MNLTKGTNLDLLIFEYLKFKICSEAYQDPDDDYFNLHLQVPSTEKEQLLLDYLKFLDERGVSTIVVGYKSKLPFKTKNIVLVNQSYDLSYCRDLYYNPLVVCIFFDYIMFNENKSFWNSFHNVMEPLTVIRID